MINILQTNHSQ